MKNSVLDHALCAARNLLVRDCNIADAVFVRGDAERVKGLSNGTYTVAVIGKSVNTFDICVIDVSEIVIDSASARNAANYGNV